MSYKSFCDLSICETKHPELIKVCETLVELGYKAVAVNQIMGEPQFPSKKNKKKLDPQAEDTGKIPEPVSLEKIQKMFEGKLTIVNRLTFQFSDQLQAHKILQSPLTKKYHLLAAIPCTQTAYQLTCASLNVDIVSFDPINKYPIKQNSRMYNLAARRGLYFELMYVPAGSDGLGRQNIISRGHQYHYFGKSKNIIISSGASFPLHLKGPYDVINIGLIFGLSEEQSKYAITEAGKKILRHAECRKLGKIAPILVNHSGQHSEDENDSDNDNDNNEMKSLKKRPRMS